MVRRLLTVTAASKGQRGSGNPWQRTSGGQRARAVVPWLLADLPRNNCWSIAERAGDLTPDGMQHLLARLSDVVVAKCVLNAPSVWNSDALVDRERVP